MPLAAYQDEQEQEAAQDDDEDDDDHIFSSRNDQHFSEQALLSQRSLKPHQENFIIYAQREAFWPYVRNILSETAPTLFFAIIGLTFTGRLLEKSTHWRALKEVDELYILIPILNNLKGSLELNLSSRLSTAAVLGELDAASARKTIMYGTISLLQVQALVVSAIAAILSFLLGKVMTANPQNNVQAGFLRSVSSLRRPPPTIDKLRSGLAEFVMVLCTAMASASASGLILSSFMCSLIMTCRRFHRNPDNIAPPMASCLGDLLTLCILGLVSSALIHAMDTAMPAVIICILIFGAIAAVVQTLNNRHVQGLIGIGWIPLFGAMVISSGTGMVLEHFVTRYKGFGLFSIGISGLPDAVGSIFVSRISTSLHAFAKASPSDGQAAYDPRIFVTAVTLFAATLPVQFLYVTFLQITGWMSMPWLFVILFVLFLCCAVLAALSIANYLTHFLWRRGLDPDIHAMPIQSSMVDLVGQLLLVACYEVAQRLGADVKHNLHM